MNNDTNTIKTTFHSESFVKKDTSLSLETSLKLQNLRLGRSVNTNESSEYGIVIALNDGFIFMTDMCAVRVIGSVVTPVDEELAQSIIRNNQ